MSQTSSFSLPIGPVHVALEEPRESFAEYVKGVDLLYHESTYGNEFADLAKETFHSTAGQAARMAVLAGVKHLLLGHFSSRYPDPRKE